MTLARPVVLIVALVLPVLTSCATANGFQIALQAQVNARSGVGVIPRSLSNQARAQDGADRLGSGRGPAAGLIAFGDELLAFGDVEEGQPPEIMAPLTLVGDKACFVYSRDPYSNASGLTGEEYTQSNFDIVKRSDFVLETFDSLASLPTRPLVQKGTGTRLEPVQVEESLRIVQLSKRKWVQGSYSKTLGMPTYVFTLCGPAPVLSPNVRYVTVSMTNWAIPGMLFVWEVTDATEPTYPLR